MGVQKLPLPSAEHKWEGERIRIRVQVQLGGSIRDPEGNDQESDKHNKRFLALSCVSQKLPDLVLFPIIGCWF